jgi:hypothetical protein
MANVKMRVEIVDLTGDNLRDAPEFSGYPFSCKYCLYWECPEEFKDLERKRNYDRKKIGVATKYY